jgi:hypothetical protein
MMTWFGKRHDAPLYSECPQTETPVGRGCVYCDEPIAMGDDGFIYAGGDTMHRECHLRGVIGSVAHQQKRCSCYGGNGNGEEEGMTRRQDAQAALEYFERHGIRN